MMLVQYKCALLTFDTQNQTKHCVLAITSEGLDQKHLNKSKLSVKAKASKESFQRKFFEQVFEA
jgi:hypothetical protein